MAKLAFLGLGLMGTPMATWLLEAGHDVTVWNRTSAAKLTLRRPDVVTAGPLPSSLPVSR